ncbi:unnamed protein product [Cunninghamella blakesleeana]
MPRLRGNRKTAKNRMRNSVGHLLNRNTENEVVENNVTQWYQCLGSSRYSHKKKKDDTGHNSVIGNFEGNTTIVDKQLENLVKPFTSEQQEHEEEEEDQGQKSSITHDCIDVDLSATISIGNKNDRYIYNGFDIYEAFYRYQLYVKDYLKENILTMEIDTHHILALSSILLLKKDRMHPEIKKFMNSNIINNVIDEIYEKLNMDLEFSNIKMMDMIKIVKHIYNGKISHIEGSFKLLEMAKEADVLYQKIILSIQRLLQDLSKETIIEKLQEAEFSLSPLFDDHEQHIVLRFTNLQNQESKTAGLSISCGRPDCVISQFEDHYPKFNLGFGEIKQLSESNNHYAVNKVLVRLEIFSKNAIDVNHIKSIISLHIVGPYVIFCLTELPNDGLYTMTGLTHLKLPLSIADLPSYLIHLEKLKNVLYIFREQCKSLSLNESITTNSSRSRPTISLPAYKTALNNKTNCKRKNPISHYYN